MRGLPRLERGCNDLNFKRRNDDGPVVIRHKTAAATAVVWTAGDVSEEAILIVGSHFLLHFLSNLQMKQIKTGRSQDGNDVNGVVAFTM